MHNKIEIKDKIFWIIEQTLIKVIGLLKNSKSRSHLETKNELENARDYFPGLKWTKIGVCSDNNRHQKK